MFRCYWLLSFGIAATACHHKSHHHDETAKLQVTSPLRRTTELTKSYIAQIRAIQHIELRALEKGYLQRVFVDEGQAVAAGKPLFQLMPRVYQAEVKRAQAEAKLNEIELKNTKLLADNNVVSTNELALVNAKLDKAKAEVALAATHQSLTTLNAPFAGLVGRFEVRLGSLVAEGDLLTTLSDTSAMWVYFNVSEVEYLQYRAAHKAELGTTVALEMANGERFAQAGKIDAIEAAFDSTTGNLAFRATFANPDGLLRHGETGRVVLTETLPNAMLIPQKATFDVLDKKFVYVADANHKLHAREITVAAELTDVYVVAKGLADTDVILLEGLRKVKDGDEIEPDPQPAAEVMKHLAVPAE